MKQSIQKNVTFLVVLMLTGTFTLPAWGEMISQNQLSPPRLGTRDGGEKGKDLGELRDALIAEQAVRDGANRPFDGRADEIADVGVRPQEVVIADPLVFDALRQMLTDLKSHRADFEREHAAEERATWKEAQRKTLLSLDEAITTLEGKVKAAGEMLSARQADLEHHLRELGTAIGDNQGSPEYVAALQAEIVAVDGRLADLANVLNSGTAARDGGYKDLSIAALLEQLRAERWSIRKEVVGELVSRGPSAVSELSTALEEELSASGVKSDVFMQEVLILALTEIGDQQALPVLGIATESRAPTVEGLARQAVQKIGTAARDGGRRVIDLPSRIASLEKSITTVETTLRNGKVDAREMERLSGQLRRLQAQVADLEVGKALLPSLGEPISESVIGHAKQKPKRGEVEVIAYDLGFLANNLDRATALAREAQAIKNYGIPDKNGIMNVLLPYAVSPGEGGIPMAIHSEDIDKALQELTVRIRRYSGDETLSLTPDIFLIVPHEKLWDFNGMNLYISTYGYGHSMTRLFMRKQLVEDLRIEELARKSTIIDSLDIYTYDPIFLGNNQTGVDELGKILGSRLVDKVHITSIKVINIPEQAKAALEELRNALDALRKV